MKQIRKNQSTICDQLRDMDLKIDTMHSVLTKFNIPGMIEDILGALNKPRQQPCSGACSVPKCDKLMQTVKFKPKKKEAKSTDSTDFPLSP